MSFAETFIGMEKAPGKSRILLMLQSDQMQISLTKYNVLEFTKTGSMVPDAYVRTGPIAKGWLLEPRRLKFMECDAASKCVTKIMPSLQRVFAQQVPNEESNIVECKDFENKARTYFGQMALRKVTQRQNVGSVPSSARDLHSSPVHFRMFQ